MNESINEIEARIKKREEAIIRIVHQNTSVNPMEDPGSRRRDLVESRFLAMKLIRENLNYSLSKVAAVFNRDHSTAIYGIRSYKNLMEFDKKYRELYEVSMNDYRKTLSEFPDPTLPKPKQLEQVIEAYYALLNKHVTMKGEMDKIKYIVDRLPKTHQQKFKNERLFCNPKQEDN